MKNLAFYLIAAAAISIVVLREVYPDLKFDGISLTLLAIAAVAIILPRLLLILPPLKKAKYKDFEIEFEKEIGALEVKVAEVALEAEETELKGEANYPPLHKAYVEEFQSIALSTDPSVQKILRAAILTEKMIIQSAIDLGIEVQGNVKSPTVIIKMLVKEGAITEKESSVFNSFWDLRNKIVHGQMTNVTYSQTLRIMSLVWRLVTIFG